MTTGTTSQRSRAPAAAAGRRGTHPRRDPARGRVAGHRRRAGGPVDREPGRRDRHQQERPVRALRLQAGTPAGHRGRGGADPRRQKSSSPRSRPAPAWPSWRRCARRSSATCSAASSPAAASSPPRRWRWAPAPGRSRTGSPPSSPVSRRCSRSFAATALEQHELPAREDPDRLAFELHAILLGADTKFVLHDDPAVLDLARQVVRQRLGLDNGTNPGQAGPAQQA